MHTPHSKETRVSVESFFQTFKNTSFPLSHSLSLSVSVSFLSPAVVCVRRCRVPVTSWWPTRWRMGAGVRTLSPVSSVATCRVLTPRSTTPAGPCWASWLLGNSNYLCNCLVMTYLTNVNLLTFVHRLGPYN